MQLSYNDIVDMSQQITENDSAESIAFAPTAVALAQARLQTELDLEGMASDQILSVVSGTRTVNKPDGYRLSHNAFITLADGSEKALRQASSDYLRDYWPNPTQTGIPEYISTDFSDAQFLLAPTPNLNTTLKLKSEVDVPLLSTTNQTNFLSTRCGEAFLYATIVERAKFDRNTDLMNVYEQSTQTALQALNLQAQRNRKSNGGTVGQAKAGGPNTLAGGQ